MADDFKASQLPPPASVHAGIFWAAADGASDVKLSLGDIRPGVSAYGMRLALGSNLRAVADAIDPDITVDATIRWQGAARITTGDPLFLLIQSTLAFTEGQMTILMTAAAAYE